MFSTLPNLTTSLIRHREKFPKNPIYFTRDLVKFKLVGIGILKNRKFFFLHFSKNEF